MKIYSWNVYCYNRSIPKVVDYIQDLDFDVLCLQEVPGALLAELERLPFSLEYQPSVHRMMREGKGTTDYVAILSRQPIRNMGSLKFFNFPFPPHARFIISLTSLFRHSFVTDRAALYADIEWEGELVRVFSVHLTLWGAGNRSKEFEAVTGHVQPGRPTIICGDFNIIEYGPMKILNWVLGDSLKEGLPWYPERDLFEERFEKAGFRNPLRAHITHPFSKSQLDHILVTKDIAAGDAGVRTEKNGSDHLPVYVTISRAQ